MIILFLAFILFTCIPIAHVKLFVRQGKGDTISARVFMATSTVITCAAAEQYLRHVYHWSGSKIAIGIIAVVALTFLTVFILMKTDILKVSSR